MSPSPHSSSWRIFSSARLVTFSFQLEKKTVSKIEVLVFFENLFSSLKIIKLCIFNYSIQLQKYLSCCINSDKWSLESLMTILQIQNLEIGMWFLTSAKKNPARFQLKNWKAPARFALAWLGTARNLFSSARLSLGNFSSNSSLIIMYSHFLKQYIF